MNKFLYILIIFGVIIVTIYTINGIFRHSIPEKNGVKNYDDEIEFNIGEVVSFKSKQKYEQK